MDEIDFDNMTDEQMEAILSDIQQGKYNDSPNGGSDDADADLEEANSNNDEDTEDDESNGSDSETNEQDDGADQDTEDDSDEESSENTPVEKDTVEEGEPDSSTDTQDADLGAENGTIDTADYERYKKFYETVANAEFKANGKRVKGFTDPEKIIQAQQMAYGFSDKMAAFKQYRPYMASLKDRGMLEDPSKFNFVMDLLDGDPEALKQHMQSLKVDPLDLDMDSVSYSSKNHITSQEQLILEDTLEKAKDFGVEDKLRDTIGKQWDQESFNEFLTVPSVRSDLLEHMSTGAFDLVQERIREMKTLDVSGSFGSMKATDQYRQAVQSLTADANRQNYQAGGSNKSAPVQRAAASKPTVDKTADLTKKQEAEYKRNLEEKNRVAEDSRKKAASLSKKKVSTTSQKKFDPMSLEGKEFDDYVASLIRS
ncbi:MAG: hypothetical protein JHC33_11615 [Ignisphaera sp.]|nr:hypothetical protein [Ignisphaera sp.]